jgi:hypothetical protein
MSGNEENKNNEFRVNLNLERIRKLMQIKKE